MRSLSLQSIRSAGVGQALQNGLTVQWTAAASTVAAPTTIWSENTGDANNQITVKYNGVVVYLTKIVAGVPTYVTVPFVATNGVVYPIKITLLSNNRLTLTVNGTASSDNFGNELISNGTFITDTTGWAVTSTATVSVVSNRLRVTRATAGYADAKQVLTGTTPSGRIFRLYSELTNTLALNSYQAVAAVTDKQSTAASATLSSIWISASVNSTIAVGLWTGAGSVGQYTDFDNISVKEIYNNTDTTAIPWATVL